MVKQIPLVDGTLPHDVPADAASTGLKNLQAPSGLAPAGLAQAQAGAGPQFNIRESPWRRPTNNPDLVSLFGCHHARWPGRAANFAIPMPVQPLPGLQSDQTAMNTFLKAVQNHYPRTRVFPREVVADTARARTLEFGQPHLDVVEDLPLNVYGGTVTDLRAFRGFGNGQISIIASRDAGNGRTNQYAVERYVEQYYAHLSISGQAAQVQQLLPAAAPGTWHDCGVLVLSIQRYPDQQGNPNRTRRMMLVYDPSFILENPATRAVFNGLMQQPPLSPRFGQLNFIASVHRYWMRLRTTGSAWVREETRIGGGGNLGVMDECRYMVCAWVQQTAWLVQNLTDTVARVLGQPSAANIAAFQQAEREFEDFFGDYVTVVP